MTQEIIDLKKSIIEGRYADALLIIDELEGMSKKAILRQIKSLLRILLIHLIKNQVEQRLTNSWASSIRNSIREIQDLNLKENQTSYYINSDEWETWLEDEIEATIRDASNEVMNGSYSPFQLLDIVDKSLIITQAQQLLGLTSNYSAKELLAVIDDYVTQLPGGEDWKAGRRL